MMVDTNADTALRRGIECVGKLDTAETNIAVSILASAFESWPLLPTLSIKTHFPDPTQ
jgi:hypothetical protein